MYSIKVLLPTFFWFLILSGKILFQKALGSQDETAKVELARPLHLVTDFT